MDLRGGTDADSCNDHKFGRIFFFDISLPLNPTNLVFASPLRSLSLPNSLNNTYVIYPCKKNDQSMLTFEGQQVQGSANIIAKLKSVGGVSHSVKTTDIQPSSNPNAIVIFVTGAIQIGGDNPLHFCEFFHLVGTAPGQYYVHNVVFRLNYGL